MASGLALAVYGRYEEQGESFVPAYLDLLKAGGSRSPEELGQIVGVDLADPGFWDRGLDIVELRHERRNRQELPSGRSIDLFFYDGPVSRAVAFEDLLRDGARFANRLAGAFSEDREWPQLAHIATDGETYGHHRRHGEMALAYALEDIEARKLAKRTNYGEYLERHPPTLERPAIGSGAMSDGGGSTNG
jgi:hypothetical protein